MQNISGNQASPEIPINENFASLEWASCLTRNPVTSSGLVLGYYGGLWSGLTIADGTLSLTASNTHYVVVHRQTGAVSSSTATTNWNKPESYARMFEVVTGTYTIFSVKAWHGGVNGVHGSVLLPVGLGVNSVGTGSSVDISGIPTGINRVTLALDGVSTSGTSRVLLQLGDSGGIENTSYVGALTESSSASSNWVSGTAGAILAGATAGTKRYGNITILRQHPTSFLYTITASVYAEDGASGFVGTTVCHKGLNTDLISLRLTTVGGTELFDNGSVNCFIG
jgi:hypothetical protein